MATLAYTIAGGPQSDVCERPGFDVLDDVVRLAETRGVLWVRVTSFGDSLGIAQHLARRAAALGRQVVRAGGRVESVWRDLGARLGLSSLSADPIEAAKTLAHRASSERSLVVVALFDVGAWDRAVTEAIALQESSALFVALAPATLELDLPGVPTFEVSDRLNDAGLARWWDAVAESESSRAADSLARLDGWFDAASRTRTRSERTLSDELTPAARKLFDRLSLAGRAWPFARISELGDAAAVAALVTEGVCEVRDGLVALRGDATSDVQAPTSHDRAATAQALLAVFGEDAWALTRAAELEACAGDANRAETIMAKALALVTDSASRGELWKRWRVVVEALPSDQAGPIRLRGAELALELGDVDIALEWAQRASSTASARAAFVLGSSALARGDLVSATAALSRARDLAVEPAARHAAELQIAEVRYRSADYDGAAALASEILGDHPEPGTRINARNLLGKQLLARGEYAAADAHFANDECEALCLGDVTAALRARVNRAIALLSRGSTEEADAILTGVLSEAEQRGEPRAISFALTNLAVLAIERHDYGRALELLERALAAHRRLGERMSFVRAIGNLVELRLRIGLVEQAEQALRFGRHALGPGLPASRLAEIALAAAQVHLARGRTLDAEREVRTALRTASLSSDGDKLGEGHRLAARIALEDGVIARAVAEVAEARKIAHTPFDRAEIALLDALIARASGRPAYESASAAVTATRESGDEELAREAHVLAAELAFSDGDEAAAAAHVRAAAALRDEIASTLSPSFREAYFSRPALARLARLERVAESSSGEASREVPSVPPPRVDRSSVRYVGRHPSVRALLDAVGRVGRTGATVLIHGESGTGKELVAEQLHAASDRASGPMVKVNCAALVESLLLSELFGHEKGAFTGANARRRGRFERANGGTLFLDEIGDISPRTQVALLRVLEERRIERVGGTSPMEVDVRIVCASNKDLGELVERGLFREDLYYRLSGITLEVPALRDRLSDLPLLVEAILERIARERGEAPKGITAEALELLARHRWPGNVRELENALRAVSVLSDGPALDQGDLVEHVEAFRKAALEPVPSRREGFATTRPPAPVASSSEPGEEVEGVAYREIRDNKVSLSDLKRNIERECIARALSEAGGNITRAATLLGMKRPRLSQLVKQYGFLVGTTEDP